MEAGRNAALGVALEQRQRVLDLARQVLSQRDRNVQEQALALTAAQARVKMVLQQMDVAQRPESGMQLPVAALRGLERLLDWCEVHVALAQDRLYRARGEAEQSRGIVAVAHQHVRALELVLEARAAELAGKAHRDDVRNADETAARVHARNAVAR